jgi:hypothetical protein
MELAIKATAISSKAISANVNGSDALMLNTMLALFIPF